MEKKKGSAKNASRKSAGIEDLSEKSVDKKTSSSVRGGATFVKLGDVKGESTSKGHEGHIEI
jgi:hypothetical protein